MKESFEKSIAFVLEHETEYDSNGDVICEHDKHDPGGTTKFGIDQRSHPHVDICALTEDEAIQIYHDNEWTKCRCNDLPMGFDLAVFDAAVNLGMGWAIPALQKVVGVKSEGFIGPKTLVAVSAAGSKELSKYLDTREAHYKSLPTRLRLRYLKGWIARTEDLRTTITV